MARGSQAGGHYRMADMSPSVYRRIEVGAGSPPIKAPKTSGGLGVQIVDLLEEERRPRKERAIIALKGGSGTRALEYIHWPRERADHFHALMTPPWA